jgi:hypothetical protein
MSINLSGDEIMALVSSGMAVIGIGDFIMTKERDDVLAFTDTVGFGR